MTTETRLANLPDDLKSVASDLLEQLTDLVESCELADPGVYDLDDAKAAIARASQAGVKGGAK